MKRYLLLSIGTLGLVVLLGNLHRIPPPPLQTQYQRVYGQPTALPTQECLPYLSTINTNDYYWHIEYGGGRIDNEGIALYTHDSGHYRPLYIAHIGILALRAACEQRDPLGYAIALHHADWLVENAEYQNNYAVWRYNFTYEGLDAGWISSLSQAVGAAFLTQVYQVTGDLRYALTARAALGAFALGMDSGGVRVALDSGVWFAQNAQPYTDPILPLNGLLLTLEALAYTGDYLPSDEAQAHFHEGELTLRTMLPSYDAGDSQVYYSLNPEQLIDPSSADGHTYLTIHIVLLNWLYQRTGNPLYLTYAERWQGYRGDH